ncbi:MAG: DUF3455 domain-containing protein [Bacteroidota bacterium]
MKNFKLPDKEIGHRILLAVCAMALVLASAAAMPRPARADKITPPPVPSNIQVPAGSKVFLVGHATGTQNYICLPSGAGVAFTLFTPQATLFNGENEQIITHFFSPNPFENGTVRPTWEDSRDTSMIWAQVVPGGSSTDPNYVAPGAIAWLLLQVLNHRDGPNGGDRLSATAYIQRLNTTGGVAPSTGCASLADIGNRAYVPYTADYFFYR